MFVCFKMILFISGCEILLTLCFGEGRVYFPCDHICVSFVSLNFEKEKYCVCLRSTSLLEEPYKIEILCKKMNYSQQTRFVGVQRLWKQNVRGGRRQRRMKTEEDEDRGGWRQRGMKTEEDETEEDGDRGGWGQRRQTLQRHRNRYCRYRPMEIKENGDSKAADCQTVSDPTPPALLLLLHPTINPSGPDRRHITAGVMIRKIKFCCNHFWIVSLW